MATWHWRWFSTPERTHFGPFIECDCDVLQRPHYHFAPWKRCESCGPEHAHRVVENGRIKTRCGRGPSDRRYALLKLKWGTVPGVPVCKLCWRAWLEDSSVVDISDDVTERTLAPTSAGGESK